MVSSEEAKNIIQCEYAKNLSVILIIDETEDIDEYMNIFVDLFKKVYISSSYDRGHQHYIDSKNKYDLVIVHINKEINQAKNLLKDLRSYDENVYIMTFSVQANSFYFKVNRCAYEDAIMPFPLNKEYTYKFLYRVLKRISDLKDLEFYVKSLEDILNNEDVKVTKKINKKKPKRSCSDNLTKVIASDFLETLDVTIIDKIELFQEELDNYTMVLYDIEALDAEKSLEKLQTVIKILDEFSIVVNSLVVFPIIEESITNLVVFLNSLEISNFEDISKKKFLVNILLGLGKDLETWVKTIFIDKDTSDIHYLDISFLDSYVEIEALFNKNESDVEEDDDSELEFF